MQHLSLLAQNVLNQPLACSDQHALMMAAVFSGKLNIESLVDRSRDVQYSGDDMDKMRAVGRIDADSKRARRAVGPWGSLVEGQYHKKTKDGKIAVIDVQGTLTRTWGAESYSGTTGYDGIKMAFDDALRDDDVKAIWFDGNSPGGAVNGMLDLSRYIAAHNYANTGKLTVGYAGDYAYSAAYGILSSCDKLYCPDTGGVGSVGTIALFLSYADMLKNEGVAAQVLRYPEEKALGHSLEPMNDEYLKTVYEDMVEITHLFQSTVATNRGIDVNAVAQTRGRTYMGKHAKAIGFVDEVLSEQIAWAAIEEFVKLDGGHSHV